MPIFKISPTEEPKELEQQTQVQDTQPAEEGKEPSDASAAANTGYIPARELDEKTIIMDGPLSQIYTQALNQMYAKESYVTELKSLNETSDDELESQLKASKANYVYVVDGDYLEKGLVDAFQTVRLACEKFAHVSVCVEHDMKITNNVALFMDTAEKCGAKIMFNREKTLSMLKTPWGK